MGNWAECGGGKSAKSGVPDRECNCESGADGGQKAEWMRKEKGIIFSFFFFFFFEKGSRIDGAESRWGKKVEIGNCGGPSMQGRGLA